MSARRIATLLVCCGLWMGPAAQAATKNKHHTMTKQQRKLYHQESGFLGPMYAKLRPDPENKDWLIYLRSRNALRSSKTFLVEPVKIHLLREARRREIPPEELHKLSEHFTQAIKDELVQGVL